MLILVQFLLTMTMGFIMAEKKDLNIMGLLPMTGNLFRGGKACLIGANMALRHVNSRDAILSDYKLNFIWEDTQCAAGPAINKLFQMLYTTPTKHMIFGPGCSTEAEVTAKASPEWNLTTLSWGAASPLLSDKSTFPRFFRVTAPDSRRNYATVELARLFKWKKIATLNVALDYFSAVIDHLVNLVKDTEISIISEEIFSHDPLTRIQNLKKKDARIILAAAYGSHGKQIVCAAYQAGLYGPKIVWMFPGWFKDRWWESSYPDVPCTVDQMAQVVEGSILPGFFFSNINIERGIANITVPEYTELYRQEEDYKYITEYEYISPNCYDGIWGIALALNCTDSVLKQTGHVKSLDQFEYADSDIADIITSCTSNLSFLGLTGQVQFDSSGDPTKNIKIDQIQGGEKVLVGVYWPESENWVAEWYNGGIVWKDGVPPRDSTLITEIEERIPKYLYIAMSCFAAAGIVLAILCVVFSIIHRNNKYVKMSSPNINNVLLLGCTVTYTSVFMESLEKESVALCKSRTYTFIIGFSMAFGALFSKTWRVYRIFSNKKLLQLRLRDYQLIGVVIGLLGVLCFVLVIWEIVDPLFIQMRYLQNEIYLVGNDAEVHPYVRLCTSKYYTYFSWTIYIMEGALLSFGAFLAFETRKVKIEALNDSRLIGMCLYNVVVLSVVGLTLNLALEDKVALLYGINSGVLIIGTTGTLLVVFIPKIMVVYCPNRVDINKTSTLDGRRLATATTSNSRKIAQQEGIDTTSSTLKPSGLTIHTTEE